MSQNSSSVPVPEVHWVTNDPRFIFFVQRSIAQSELDIAEGRGIRHSDVLTLIEERRLRHL